MSLSIGIIGLPNVGKSTLFTALTKKQVEIANYPFVTIDPNVGVVEVPDERLEKLTILSNSKKTIPAVVEFVDIAGLVKGANKGEGLGNKFLHNIREVDVILYVIRVFKDSNIQHVAGSVDPKRDIEILRQELALKDLDTLEKRIQKTEGEANSGNKEAKEELEILNNFVEVLNSGKHIIEYIESKELGKKEEEFLIELQLLTSKKAIYLFNSKEEAGNFGLDLPTISINVREELDSNTLTGEERAELGLQKSKLNELIVLAYSTLDLITFFTTGEDETRAWTIKKGAKAPEAAGVIHTDFQQKFIRAEVISCNKLLEIRGWAKAREAGLLRTEGKDYIVQDGNVVYFLHS